MRILIVSPYFPPQPAVASFRVHGFASTWARSGEDVVVLTTRKRQQTPDSSLPNEKWRVEEIPFRVPRALEILRGHFAEAARPGAGTADPSITGKTPSRIPRFLQHLRDRTGVFGSVRMPDLTDRWVRPAVRWAEGQPPWDVVFSSAGPYTAHLVALALRTKGKARFWAADYRDLWVGNPVARGLFPFTLRERVLQRRCFAAHDLVTTVSEPLAETLRQGTPAPVHVIYNGYDPDEPVDEQPAFNDDELVRLVFTGRVYPGRQNVEPIMAALGQLKGVSPDRATRLRLVIAGPSGDWWQKVAKNHGVDDLLDYRGVARRATAFAMQRDADALVLFDFAEGIEGMLTTKAFEYLAAKAPILLIGRDSDSSLAQLVRNSRRGVVLGCNVEAIVEALTTLTSGKPVLTADVDREFIQQFSRQNQSERLLALLREHETQKTTL